MPVLRFRFLEGQFAETGRSSLSLPVELVPVIKIDRCIALGFDNDVSGANFCDGIIHQLLARKGKKPVDMLVRRRLQDFSIFLVSLFMPASVSDSSVPLIAY